MWQLRVAVLPPPPPPFPVASGPQPREGERKFHMNRSLCIHHLGLPQISLSPFSSSSPNHYQRHRATQTNRTALF